MSQARLGRDSGIPQPNISAIESGRRDPSTQVLARLLVATGHRLDTTRDPARSRYLRPRLVELGAWLAEAPDDSRRRLVAAFLDGYERSEPVGRAVLIEDEPGPTGDPRWDAFLAGLAEHLAYHDRLPAPRWVNGPGRFLSQFFFPVDLPSVRRRALAESPPAFRRRGVYLAEGALRRA